MVRAAIEVDKVFLRLVEDVVFYCWRVWVLQSLNWWILQAKGGWWPTLFARDLNDFGC